MNFDLTEEQKLLKDQVEKFIANEYDFDKRRKISESDLGMSQEHWSFFAEQGLLGVPFTEEQGGFGGGPVENMVIMEAFGTGLLVEPYYSTVIVSGSALALAGSASQQEELITKIVEGEAKVALAYAEPQSRFSLHDVATTATKDSGDYVLNGHKAVVFHGPFADYFIVSARTAGGQFEASGISLFIMPANADGVERNDYRTADGQRASEVRLNNVKVGGDAVLGELDNALPILEQVAGIGIAAVCAEAVGAMKVLHDDTLEYLKTRSQFGKPIGTFQVLQHRMADIFINYEQARSMAILAALSLEDQSINNQQNISAAKMQICQSGQFIGRQAVQMHGGIGMTDELNIGHYFKRLIAIETVFGNYNYHAKRFERLEDELIDQAA